MSEFTYPTFYGDPSTPLSLREATPEDTEFLYQILHIAAYEASNEALPEGFGTSLQTARSYAWFNRYVMDWGRDNDFGLIASTEDGKQVAAASYREYDETDYFSSTVDKLFPAHPFIELAIGIKKGYRGNGLGPFLPTHLARQAGTTGFPSIHLCVSNSNTHAQHVYEGVGFRTVSKTLIQKSMVKEL